MPWEATRVRGGTGPDPLIVMAANLVQERKVFRLHGQFGDRGHRYGTCPLGRLHRDIADPHPRLQLEGTGGQQVNRAGTPGLLLQRLRADGEVVVRLAESLAAVARRAQPLINDIGWRSRSRIA